MVIKIFMFVNMILSIIINIEFWIIVDFFDVDVINIILYF